MSFDPIPDEVWDDWKWFVFPEGCLLGLREGTHRLDNSDIVISPCYVVNLPKLIMSDIMWASRLENTSQGIVDTDDYFRSVRVSVDSLIDGIVFLLSQHPMVLRRRTSEAVEEKEMRDALEKEEFILVNQGSEAQEQLNLADLDVQFFNPYGEGAKPCNDLIGLIPAENCIKELTYAKSDLPNSVVREVIGQAINELEKRQMIKVENGVVVGMTAKGKAVLDVEPVHDMFSCRCEVESPGQ
jgi:hypothetical protein